MAFNMAISIEGRKRDGVKYSIDSNLNGEVTLKDSIEFLREVQIATFREVLKEEQSIGFPKDAVIKVDNQFSKPVELVKAFGKIEAFAKQSVAEVLNFIYDTIYESSRVDTGNYRESNVVFFNGTLIARDRDELRRFINSGRDFKRGDKFEFINLAPYARRLETLGASRGLNRARTGKSRKTGRTIKVPNGTYKIAERKIRSKFGRVSGSVKFSFKHATSQAASWNSGKSFWEPGPTSSPKKQAGRFLKDGRPYLYPTITFRVHTGGITI